MSKEMKNIIILKNIYSQFFEEVIFILKRDDIKKSKDLVDEAKKIVEDYINTQDKITYKSYDNFIELKGMEKGKKINAILNISLIISILIFALMLTKVF